MKKLLLQCLIIFLIKKNNIIFATSLGNIRRNKLNDFHNINANGKIAMKLKEKDSLVNVVVCSDKDNIFMSTRLGKCVRFSCKDLKSFFWSIFCWS